ncbi:MAG: SEC-C metal-binding domain-containing protein [Defluviitaleaceae bacterium]|nr:SEC-C metal-binding domain-containing protein [Defluviitaleaceae bacterium]
MAIYEKWVQGAYDNQGNVVKKMWDTYLPLEQKIYENMLAAKDPVISGTVAQLAEKHGMTAEFIAGFLDGISGAIDIEIDMETLAEDTQVDAKVDFEALYKQMVELKADHLANLPQWDNVYTPEERQRMYKEQKASGTVVREGAKVGRNDPCPCDSGKKYKKCCGAA